MFCPKCGRDCGNDRVCISCGCQTYQMRAQHQEMSTTEAQTKSRDLMYYFEQYQPNRTAAINALRKDTNMGLIEAKKLIDRLFDEQSNQSSSNTSVAFQNLKFAIKGFVCKQNNAEVTSTQKQENDDRIAVDDNCEKIQNNQEATVMGFPDGGQVGFSNEQEPQLYADYSRYYIEYRQDRVKAIMALRVDTGMGAVEAKRIIDALFDSREIHTNYRNEPEAIDDDLKFRVDAGGKVYCPKCLSSKLFVHKENITRPIGYYRTAVFRLMGSIVNLCYTIWGKRIEYVCLECGHRWKK